MHTRNLSEWRHDHTFGQDEIRAGVWATIIVIVLTSTMMTAEITAGIVFGSMALLADGLHMASHAVALGITVFAYVYARRFATDRRYSFGTGKVNALAGFTSAIALLGFALLMVFESVGRLINPLAIAFNQALFVAVLGLVVNLISARILASSNGDHLHDLGSHHSDHNLKAAYLHVLTDALTSLLAIFALLAGKWFGLEWMDPLMGIVGAAVVTRWSIGLIKGSGRVLLDWQATEAEISMLRDAIERGSEDRITDVHIWSIAPGKNSAEIVIVTHRPQSPEHYRSLIPDELQVVHAIIEIHECGT